MIKTILIANRGEVACRIIQTCHKLGIRVVAVYADADANTRHVQLADEAVHIGPSPATDSYLDSNKIIAAAKQVKADAIHPGFGFLAENADFAQACADAGLIFIGPRPEAIAVMGNKSTAKSLGEGIKTPLIPGYGGANQSNGRFQQAASQIGYPVMVKAAAGGGGKGMRVVNDPSDFIDALESARHEALTAFGTDELLLEKALIAPRHIEIQVLGDQHGHIIHLGERECSIQRRHQKVIEESPVLTVELRQRIGATAVALAQKINYSNVGTVEFLLDQEDNFYFLEMNTRLQVEHPVTEMVTSIDLVEWQIRIAEGQVIPWDQEDISLSGHAIEARIYAENPALDFLPVTGEILLWQPPKGSGIRVESSLLTQDHISRFYDPMLAKIIAHGPERSTAIRRLHRALESAVLLGITSNLAYLRDVVAHPAFLTGETDTQFLTTHFAAWQPAPGDVALAATAVTLQQFHRQTGQANAPRYWRNNPNRPIRNQYAIEHEVITVHLTPPTREQRPFLVQLSIEESLTYQVTFDIDETDATKMWLVVDGYRQRVTAVGDPNDNWWVQTRAGIVQLKALPQLPKTETNPDVGDSLRAPMPGAILAILVEVGQHVTAGQPLLKLEAMKMEHTIRTTGAGIVEAIYYAPGETVEADAQLLKISQHKEKSSQQVN